MTTKNFDDGLYCAERVLLEIAQQHNIQSPLIPRIATGLCSGMARTGGPCGALTGGILALGLIHGRDNRESTVERTYSAVQDLTEQFKSRHKSVHCQELLGCDLGTAEGQRTYVDNQLGQRCEVFTTSTIQLVEKILKTA